MNVLNSGSRSASGYGVAAFGLVVLMALGFAACAKPAEQAAVPPPVDPVARGAYLVNISGCNDCHTPQRFGPTGLEPDMTRMLSGHPAELVLPEPPKLGEGPWIWTGTGTLTAYAGPWGLSYARNLTPDVETGIGAWTEEMFVQTIRNGKHMGTGRPLLPPMPWKWTAQMTDEDLKAVYAYLKSIPAVANQVPEPVPPPAP